MASFPNIAKPVYPFKNKLEDPVISSRMENGVVITRPRFTKIRETFTLNWSNLSPADYSTLRTFWKTTTLGGSLTFQWTHPTITGDSNSNQIFNVRFIGGDIEFELTQYGYTGTLVLQEE